MAEPVRVGAALDAVILEIEIKDMPLGTFAVLIGEPERKGPMAPKQYRKKPVIIEAMQWDGTIEGASEVIDWALAHEGTIRYHHDDVTTETRRYLAIDTLEGTMRAKPGSFIIRGVAGEFYACDPDVFERTYEDAPVHPATPTVPGQGDGW